MYTLQQQYLQYKHTANLRICVFSNSKTTDYCKYEQYETVTQGLHILRFILTRNPSKDGVQLSPSVGSTKEEFRTLVIL